MKPWFGWTHVVWSPLPSLERIWMVSISRRLQVAINYHLSVGCLSPAPRQLLRALHGFGTQSCQVLGHVNSVFDMCYVDHREPLQRPRYGRMKHFFPIYHRYFSDDCIPTGLNHLFLKTISAPRCPSLKYQPWPGSCDCHWTELIITCTLLIVELCLSGTKRN